jgi:hypothetical protein
MSLHWRSAGYLFARTMVLAENTPSRKFACRILDETRTDLCFHSISNLTLKKGPYRGLRFGDSGSLPDERSHA